MRLAAVLLLLCACGQPAAPAAPPAPPECTDDGDCALAHRIDCCDDCLAGPPFEATTDVELLHQRDTVREECAASDLDCKPEGCLVEAPRSCEARAACVAGQCVVASDGC